MQGELILLLLFRRGLIFDKLVEKNLDPSLKLVMAQFDGLSLRFLLLLALILISLSALLITSVVSAATSAVGGIRNNRTLLLHVGLLAISSIVASIVAVTIISAATATTSTASIIVIIVIIASLSLLAGSFNSCLLFLDHLIFNLFLGLDISILSLELGPTKLLVFNHILNKLLNTLACSFGAFFIGLGLIPDLLELTKDL